jgi:hypothetical protein
MGSYWSCLHDEKNKLLKNLVAGDDTSTIIASKDVNMCKKGKLTGGRSASTPSVRVQRMLNLWIFT